MGNAASEVANQGRPAMPSLLAGGRLQQVVCHPIVAGLGVCRHSAAGRLLLLLAAAPMVWAQGRGLSCHGGQCTLPPASGASLAHLAGVWWWACGMLPPL